MALETHLIRALASVLSHVGAQGPTADHIQQQPQQTSIQLNSIIKIDLSNNKHWHCVETETLKPQGTADGV